MGNLSLNASKSYDIKKDMSSEKTGGAKDIFPSKDIGHDKSPKPSPREKSMKKSSSDDIASKDAKTKGDDVPDARNETKIELKRIGKTKMVWSRQHQLNQVERIVEILVPRLKVVKWELKMIQTNSVKIQRMINLLMIKTCTME